MMVNLVKEDLHGKVIFDKGNIQYKVIFKMGNYNKLIDYIY